MKQYKKRNPLCYLKVSIILLQYNIKGNTIENFHDIDSPTDNGKGLFKLLTQYETFGAVVRGVFNNIPTLTHWKEEFQFKALLNWGNLNKNGKYLLFK